VIYALWKTSLTAVAGAATFNNLTIDE